jgi:prolyl oligopeptidase
MIALIALSLAAGPARTVDVVEDLFGTKVSDPYRWMEGNDNAETKAWLTEQGQAAADALAKIPERDAMLARVRELGLSTGGASGLQLAGGRMFFRRIAPGEQLAKLVVRDADGKDRVLADPIALGKDGAHASVNAFSPSPDGTKCAYDLALGGGEISAIHVVDVATGRETGDVVDRVWGEFAAAWMPDGKAFFYTQMAPIPEGAKEGADPMLGMTAKLHVLGQPVKNDVVVLGAGTAKSFPVAPAEFPGIGASSATPWLIAFVGGAHRETRIAVAPMSSFNAKTGAATWTPVAASYDDQVEDVALHGDELYALTFKDASNLKIIATPLAKPDLAHARVVVAEEPSATIVEMRAAKDALFVEKMAGGRASITRLPWGTTTSTPVKLPFAGWVDEIAIDERADGAVIDVEGWTKPGAFYFVDGNATKPTGIATTTSADYSNIVADEVVVSSFDGAKVPLSVVHRKDLVDDGSHPAIEYGYGGYGNSQTPSFNPTRLAWLEKGGVFAVCHVRGGGERGHQWQIDGTHEHKLNGVKDFVACGEALVRMGFTSKTKLFAQGGSMGGVLIGRAITERPDLFAAANIAVGIVNPLRILFAENGANQKSELGDPETSDGFKSILAMDSYQHVEKAAYPAVLFTIGLNDKRVAPWMTAKMAAKMMVSSTSKKPVLVRVESDAGHGVGSTRDQAFAERADVYAFFLDAAR